MSQEVIEALSSVLEKNILLRIHLKVYAIAKVIAQVVATHSQSSNQGH